MKVRTKWGKKRRKKIILPTITLEGSDASISGPVTIRQLQELFIGKEFNSVDLRDMRFLDLAATEPITKAKAIQKLTIWGKITRPAISQLLQVPGIKEAVIFQLAGIGCLRNFTNVRELEDLRVFYTLNSFDFYEIAKLPKLRKLTAHNAEVGVKAITAITRAQSLQYIDLEGAILTDSMAEALAKSQTIIDLVVPATSISAAGLRHISEMPQLRYIDIWANNLSADALDMFAGHPALEVLELGTMGYDASRVLHARDIIPKLEKIPNLNTVYFENVAMNDEEYAYLNSRYKFRLMQEKH